jgi:hypothetical protein
MQTTRPVASAVKAVAEEVRLLNARPASPFFFRTGKVTDVSVGATRVMKLLSTLRARFPKAIPYMLSAAVLGASGGYSAYARAAEDCCYPGAPCCHPGAACCARRHAAH